MIGDDLIGNLFASSPAVQHDNHWMTFPETAVNRQIQNAEVKYQSLLDRDPVVGIYSWMWKYKDRLNRTSIPPFPDTVIYEHYFPRAWYLFDHDGDPAIVRKSPKECENNSIYNAFTRQNHGDIVAEFKWRDDPKEQIQTLFLHRKELMSFLCKPRERGILQRFIVPNCNSNEAITVFWTPYMCMTERWQNLHPLNDPKIPIENRVVTENSVHCKQVVCTSNITSKIQDYCTSFVNDFAQFEKKPVKRLVMQYKLDPMMRVWLLQTTYISLGSKLGNSGNTTLRPQDPRLLQHFRLDPLENRPVSGYDHSYSGPITVRRALSSAPIRKAKNKKESRIRRDTQWKVVADQERFVETIKGLPSLTPTQGSSSSNYESTTFNSIKHIPNETVILTPQAVMEGTSASIQSDRPPPGRYQKLLHVAKVSGRPGGKSDETHVISETTTALYDFTEPVLPALRSPVTLADFQDVQMNANGSQSYSSKNSKGNNTATHRLVKAEMSTKPDKTLLKLAERMGIPVAPQYVDVQDSRFSQFELSSEPAKEYLPVQTPLPLMDNEWQDIVADLATGLDTPRLERYRQIRRRHESFTSFLEEAAYEAYSHFLQTPDLPYILTLPLDDSPVGMHDVLIGLGYIHIKDNIYKLMVAKSTQLTVISMMKELQRRAVSLFEIERKTFLDAERASMEALLRAPSTVNF
eukprot:NODE_942_length_2229_cov_21.346629_g806_i0.p1 GENE.NODE_942_length_2229_cov_21.346629_g806_i0~~NODE_942_length_2229_cov_21.346629_g806_i0.p1  ORF type:complete len:691 (+),score=130.03 NODE_942_length_2229_cov_21.346629_g806_i0:98-2170(+)